MTSKMRLADIAIWNPRRSADSISRKSIEAAATIVQLLSPSYLAGIIGHILRVG